MTKTMRLTVGPALFNWPADMWRDFYARIADEAPVDRVVVGEIVCSKRSPFYDEHIPDVIERLRRGGKDVVYGTLGLVTAPRERKSVADICANADAAVEINDLTAIASVKGAFDVGPLVNVYNEGALEFLARKGARSICLPPELPIAAVAALGAAAAKSNVDIEVWSYGRIPLAMSGRCYHARVHSLSKDSCQFVCANDDDGLDVDTLDGQHFLAINGVQTMSRAYCNLIGDIEQLRDAGVGGLRLSPHSGDFLEVCRVFRERLDGTLSSDEGMRRLAANAPGVVFSHGFLVGKTGAEQIAV